MGNWMYTELGNFVHAKKAPDAAAASGALAALERGIGVDALDDLDNGRSAYRMSLGHALDALL